MRPTTSPCSTTSASRARTRSAGASAVRSLGLIEAIADRVSAAVLQQPIGLSPKNRGLFFQMFDDGRRPAQSGRDRGRGAAAVSRIACTAKRFRFNVSRDFVRGVKPRCCVLRGNDNTHPPETSDDIAKLAPMRKSSTVEDAGDGRQDGRAVRAFEGARPEVADFPTSYCAAAPALPRLAPRAPHLGSLTEDLAVATGGISMRRCDFAAWSAGAGFSAASRARSESGTWPMRYIHSTAHVVFGFAIARNPPARVAPRPSPRYAPREFRQRQLSLRAVALR